MQDTICVFCETACRGDSATVETGPLFDCPRCGTFWLDRQAWDAVRTFFSRTPAEQATIVRYVASHVIRRSRPEAGEHTPALTKAIFDEIVRRPLPTAEEQKNLLILWMGERLPFPESRTWLPTHEVSAAIGAGKGGEGLTYIWNELDRQGLVDGGLGQSSSGLHEFNGGLTFHGWSSYQNLKSETRDSRTAFMAMKFNHKPSQHMYEKHFVPAALEAGFVLRRVDTITRPGLIDIQMMVDIRAAAFVVADLTAHSHGAYWEAGFAAGLGKPVIYTCEEGDFKSPEGTHFDVNHHVTVLWDAAKPERARSDLKALIRNALPDIAKLSDDT